MYSIMPTTATLTLPIINPFTKLHATVRDKIRQQTPNFTLSTNRTKKYVYKIINKEQPKH
jgi:hypothetical protein